MKRLCKKNQITLKYEILIADTFDQYPSDDYKSISQFKSLLGEDSIWEKLFRKHIDEFLEDFSEYNKSIYNLEYVQDVYHVTIQNGILTFIINLNRQINDEEKNDLNKAICRDIEGYFNSDNSYSNYNSFEEDGTYEETNENGEKEMEDVTVYYNLYLNGPIN